MPRRDPTARLGPLQRAILYVLAGGDSPVRRIPYHISLRVSVSSARSAVTALERRGLARHLEHGETANVWGLAVEIDVRASRLHNDGRGTDAAFLRGVLDALAGRPMSEDMLDAPHTRRPYTVGYESTTAACARAHGYDPGKGRE